MNSGYCAVATRLPPPPPHGEMSRRGLTDPSTTFPLPGAWESRLVAERAWYGGGVPPPTTCHTPASARWRGTVLLAVDIGNTNIVAGVFDGGPAGDELAPGDRSTEDDGRVRRRAPDPAGPSRRRLRDITGVSISSTVPPLTATFRRLSETYFDLPPVIASPQIEPASPSRSPTRPS